MKKLHVILFILLSIVSCKSIVRSSKSFTCTEECMQVVVDYINKTIEGSNEIHIDQRASFAKDSNIFIVYIGASETDYLQKWEIPLQLIDLSSIGMEDGEFSGYPLFFKSIDATGNFRYYKNNKFEAFTSKFAYYPGTSNGSKTNFRRKFIGAFIKAVKLSKMCSDNS